MWDFRRSNSYFCFASALDSPTYFQIYCCFYRHPTHYHSIFFIVFLAILSTWNCHYWFTFIVMKVRKIVCFFEIDFFGSLYKIGHHILQTTIDASFFDGLRNILYYCTMSWRIWNEDCGKTMVQSSTNQSMVILPQIFSLLNLKNGVPY